MSMRPSQTFARNVQKHEKAWVQGLDRGVARGAQGVRAPPFVICHSGRGYLT